jgi:hypothetical protein
MGRSVSTQLQKLLDLDGCETQTTLDLVLADTTTQQIATRAVTIGGDDYADDLRKTDEIKQNVFAPTDRVNAYIQNVDKSRSGSVTDEDLIKAQAFVGRLYSDPRGVLPSVWVELFRGELKPIQLDEGALKCEILNDLAAAGHCVASMSLAPNCQLRYKGIACGYAGLMATCNKKRKSPEGCQGHIVTGIVTNEHRFGGMEFPDPQLPEAPAGGGDIEPPPPHYCPRVDQWVPVLGKDGLPTPKLAADLTMENMIYNPRTGMFHHPKSIEIVRNQWIWETATRNMARGFSSYSHPIITDRRDGRGLRASALRESDPVLTWWPDYFEQSTASRSRATGEKGDVVAIEMVDGHIYCYGNSRVGPFIVCHNLKPVEP